MAALQDYVGITKLRDAWPKWKANVIAVNNQLVNHVAGTADKHAAQDITYTGDFTGKTEVKAALDQAKTEIDLIVVSASIDPEVAFARESLVKAKTFVTLDARLEESEQDHVTHKAENAKHTNGWVNVSEYGAIGDGVADDTAEIQAAIDYVNTQGGGKIILDGKTFLISTTLNLYNNIILVGLGMNATTLKTNANTFDAITLPSNCRLVQIKDMSILSGNDIGVSNAGIKCDDLSGGGEQLFYNLQINGFYYGIKTEEIWWNNTVENVRMNGCGYSFYSDCANGQSINNTFIRMYSNEPTLAGIRLNSAKCFTFINCNFGGHPTNTTNFVTVGGPCYGVEFLGCNFESCIIASNVGGINVWSSAQVSINGCTFVTNSGVAPTAYEIRVQDVAKVIISNSQQLIPGANITQIGVTNSAELIKLDNTLSQVSHLAGSGATSKVYSLCSPRIAVATVKLDLSGTAQEVVILPQSNTGRITKIKLLYTEASSTDVGVAIAIKSVDNFFTYYSGTSEVSKAKWYEFIPTLATTYLNSSPIIATTVGGKVGTGEVLICVEYVLDN